MAELGGEEPLTLDAVAWGHETGRHVALEHAFAIRTTDASLGRYVADSFRSLRAPGSGATTYSLVDRSLVDGAGAQDQPIELYSDDRLVISCADNRFALDYLMWLINHDVIDASRQRYVLIHASAAAKGDRAVVMPAASGSGKTTLVAGLVRAGLCYVTDEAVAMEPGSSTIVPWPKPLGVERGSWGVLAALAPSHEGLDFDLGQWHVDPSVIRGQCVAGASSPAVVLLPRYQPGPTTIERLPRADALLGMLEHSFNMDLHRAAGFRQLAAVAAGAETYRMTVGDLDEAVALVSELI